MRLEKIKIENYKGIDYLEIDFSKPQFKGVPDAIVIGSKNGLGKTSILECCALLFLALLSKESKEFEMGVGFAGKQLRGLFEKNSSIKGYFHFESNAYFSLELKMKNGYFFISGEVPRFVYDRDENNLDPDSFLYIINQIFGRDPNPLLFQHFLFFNSFRKIQEGSPELGMLVHSRKKRFIARRGEESVMNTFKVQVLRSVMLGNRALFKEFENEDSEEILKMLNGLLLQYAGVKIHRLEPYYDNTIEIQLEHQKTKEVFSFDGLSSGQKEIISTFF